MKLDRARQARAELEKIVVCSLNPRHRQRCGTIEEIKTKLKGGRIIPYANVRVHEENVVVSVPLNRVKTVDKALGRL